MKRATGYAPVRGAEIYFEVTGDGPVLLLLHGWPLDSRMWDGVVERFAKLYKVIRIDLRGAGQSPLGEIRFTDYEDIAAVLQFLNVERTSVLGLSMGGYAALEFVLTHPQMVDRLVLCSSAFDWKRPRSAIQQRDIHQLAQISASGDVEAYLDVFTHMWLDGPNQPRGRVPSPVRDFFRQMVQHNSALPNRNQLISHIEPGASCCLDEIQVPTLVMCGALDYPDEIDASIAIANGINGAQLQVFPDAAHMVPMEQPERFCDCVETFLNQWNCLSK